MGRRVDDLAEQLEAISREVIAFCEGLSDAEKANINGGQNLPTKGWVFEVRGFAFHKPRNAVYRKDSPKDSQDFPKASKDFVVDTLVENLAVPEHVGVLPRNKKIRPDHPYFQTLFHGSAAPPPAPSAAPGSGGASCSGLAARSAAVAARSSPSTAARAACSTGS